MVKTRSQTCSFPPPPPPPPPPLPCRSFTPPPASTSPYENLRLQRIAENQARMAALGVQKHAENLTSMFKATKVRKVTKRLFAKKPALTQQQSDVRRSQRLKGVPPPDYKRGVDLRYFDRIEKPKVSRLRGEIYVRNCRELGDVRPANAPMPKNCPAELTVSPALLAYRCRSKGRGSLYDPVVGICCHFCRQKKLCGEEGCERCGNRDVSKACLGKTDCARCHSNTGVFCRACLKIRYGEDIEEVRSNNKWVCPHCSEEEGLKPYWICNSSFCLSRRNIPPTGIAIFKAREMGFKSVAHYLAHHLQQWGL